MQRKLLGNLAFLVRKSKLGARKPGFPWKFVKEFADVGKSATFLFAELTSPQAVSDFLLRMSSALTFRSNPVLFERTLEFFPKYPLETVEKLPSEVLLVILKEIARLPAKEQREKCLLCVNSLLVTQIQRQNIHGLLEILWFFRENRQVFADFWTQKRNEFLVKCLRDNYEYFAYANSVEILTFLPLISLLSASPFDFPAFSLQKGPSIKLRNRKYREKSLSFEEIQCLLALDESFLKESAVVDKLLGFCEENKDDFARIPTDLLIKMLRIAQFLRFDCDFTRLNRLEAEVLKRISHALARKQADFVEWLAILAYYSAETANSRTFAGLVHENMVDLLIKTLKNKEIPTFYRENLRILELLPGFCTVSQRKALEMLIKEQLECENSKKSEENAGISLIYLHLLYKQEENAENSWDFALFQGFVSDLQEKAARNTAFSLKSLLYSYKSLAFFKQNPSFPMNSLEIQLESLLNSALKLPISLLLQEPDEFVGLLSLKSAQFPSQTPVLDRFLADPSTKTLGFSEILALHHAFCAEPSLHAVFLAFFVRKLEEIPKEMSLDLAKIASVCKSLAKARDFLLEAKRSRKLKDKQYVGRIERTLRVLQENLLRKVLRETTKSSKENIFEAFEDEVETPGNPQKVAAKAGKTAKVEKKPGLIDKNSEFSEIPLTEMFVELESREIQIIYGFFEAIVQINMGDLPIYYLLWRLIERFHEKLSFGQVIDWLFLLGVCNRLPREFPSEIATLLENEQNARNLHETPQILKLLWVVLLKNPQEIPLKLVDLLTSRLKSEEFPLKSLDFELRVRLFQLILFLIIQENKVFDPFLGLSRGNLSVLSQDYEYFLRKSRKSSRNGEGLTPFVKEIQDYLQKNNVSFQREVLLKYEGFPMVLLDFEVKQENNQGYFYVMDASIFLGTSNVERIEGWLLRKYLKVLKIKTKFLEFHSFYALERRHEKNEYIRTKLKGLKIQPKKKRKFLYEF